MDPSITSRVQGRVEQQLPGGVPASGGLPEAKTRSQLVMVAQLRASKLCVLFIDLDRFKTINDTAGHAWRGCSDSRVDRYGVCILRR